MTEPREPMSDAPRTRWLPGLPIFLASGFLAFALMANQRHLHGGVALGVIACLIAVVSLLDVLGSFDATPDMHVTDAKPSLGRSIVLTVLGFGGFIAATRLAVAGTILGGKWGAALLIPGLLLFTLAMLYRSLADLGVFGANADGSHATGPHRHPSFWLLGITIAIYTPLLGSFSLIDPWETHYGEVAREILTRDDWISLWWAQDGWFWSKPVLDFWLQALSFAGFDVNYAPDGMLSGVALGRSPYPEWAARLPMVFCSLVGQALLYAGVRRAWGSRAALIGSLLLVAVPHYAIIVHQSMTDLPYIATLMGAMGLYLLALFCPADALVQGYAIAVGRRKIVLSAYALVIGAIVLCVLPQVLYLLSRNLGLYTTPQDWGFFAHLDRFFAGSGGGNCGLPGNEACSQKLPEFTRPQPAATAAFFAVLLAVLVFLNRRERRRQRLYAIAAWLMVALSFMAKGLPGPVIAVATLCAALFLMRRWRDFEQFEFPTGLLVVACVALPWFVQMTVRHGPGFLDRLFIHDMYKRAFVHVHDTNAGDDTSIRYYLWQLGYGLFPATGLIAITIFGGFGGRGEHKDRAQATASFLGSWLLVGFAMFSLTLTKFHHYIIAIVPAACMLSGRYMGALIGDFPRTGSTLRARALHGDPRQRLFVAVSAMLLTWFVGQDLFSGNPPNGPVRLINLVTYNYSRPWPTHLGMSNVLLGFTLVTVILLLGWLGPEKVRVVAARLYLIACLGFAVWICNVYLPRIAPHWGQRDTIVEYYRRRRGPEEMLVSYQMNWKGENFYTGNRTPAFITTGDAFKRFIAGQVAADHRVIFFSLEHSRIGNLRSDLGKTRQLQILTDMRLNNKFTLVRVEL